MLTVMGIVARRHDWKLDGARAHVEKHMVSEPIRRVGRLALRLEMPSGLPAEARKPLEHAARTCPVMQSLHPDVVVDVTFGWAD
jgi:putative redox protein